MDYSNHNVDEYSKHQERIPSRKIIVLEITMKFSVVLHMTSPILCIITIQEIFKNDSRKIYLTYQCVLFMIQSESYSTQC